MKSFHIALKELRIHRKRVHYKQRPFVDRIIELVESGLLEVDIALEYAEQMALRNSEFDGDWVGRPDDDFDDDDEGEDDKENNQLI